jgi:hypothetical protein
MEQARPEMFSESQGSVRAGHCAPHLFLPAARFRTVNALTRTPDRISGEPSGHRGATISVVDPRPASLGPCAGKSPSTTPPALLSITNYSITLTSIFPFPGSLHQQWYIIQITNPPP